MVYSGLPLILGMMSIVLQTHITTGFMPKTTYNRFKPRIIMGESQNKEVSEDGVYVVDSMPKPLPTELKNTYFLLRHGQSWGNVAGVISSARALATSEKHSLTPLGYEQGKDSAADLLKLLELSLKEENAADGKNAKSVYFYSSPFSRARQTALACLDGICDEVNNKKVQNLNIKIQKELVIEDGLMERYFGRLDDAEIRTYAYVWPVDMVDECHTAFDVESVAAVSTRLRELILKIESSDLHKDGEGDFIVMASHADVLQIMQLYAAGVDNVGKFSSYRFGNGEVREMGRSPSTLPDPSPLEPPKIGT
eukprot:331830_1